MVKLKIKYYNIVLTEKQQKYQHYPQVKFINMKILPSDQSSIIEQANFTYSSLGKTFEKQIKTIEGLRKNKLKL